MRKVFKYVKNQKAFTLIELVVVVAIIGVLAAIVAPKAFSSVDKSKVTATVAEYNSIKAAVMAYYIDNNDWPRDREALVPGYLDSFPEKNAWGGSISLSVKESRFVDIDNDSYIQLTGVPIKAAKNLEKQLDRNNDDNDSGIVRYDDGNDPTTVYLVIVDNSEEK